MIERVKHTAGNERFGVMAAEARRQFCASPPATTLSRHHDER